MMTHTLGPWTVDDNYIMCRYDGNGNYICRMLGRGEETDANARLIAAAPDLLAACNKAANEFERLTGDNGFEPERFRERINIMHELNRAIVDAGRVKET